MASTDGSRPMGVSTAPPVPSTRSTTHLSTRLFSPKPGHRNDPSSPLRNQLTQNSLGSFAGSAASRRSPASGRSSRPCCSRRTGAWRTGRSAACPRRRPGPRWSPSCHDRAEEHAVVPVEGLGHEWDVGRPAAAEEDRRDGHAGGVLPLGAIAGHCVAGAVNRALGWAAGASLAGRPVVALPVDEVGRWLAVEALPPHVAVVGHGHVGEDAVAFAGWPWRWGWWWCWCRAPRRRTGLGVDRAEPSRPGRTSSRRCRRRRSRPSSPGSVGISMAMLVLPQADGNAAAT